MAKTDVSKSLLKDYNDKLIPEDWPDNDKNTGQVENDIDMNESKKCRENESGEIHTFSQQHDLPSVSLLEKLSFIAVIMNSKQFVTKHQTYRISIKYNYKIKHLILSISTMREFYLWRILG